MGVFDIYEKNQLNKQIINAGLNDFHTHLIGKIIERPNSRMCSIELLQTTLADRQGETIQTKPENLINVPTPAIFENNTWLISAPYEVGDKVEINVSERPIKEALSQSEGSEQQMHSRGQLGNSIVLRAISNDIYNESLADDKNLVVMNKKTGITFKFTDSGIELTGDLNITGDIKVSGEIKANSVDTQNGVSKGGVPYDHP